MIVHALLAESRKMQAYWPVLAVQGHVKNFQRGKAFSSENEQTHTQVLALELIMTFRFGSLLHHTVTAADNL